MISRRLPIRTRTAPVVAVAFTLALAACETNTFGPCCGQFEAFDLFRFDIPVNSLSAVYLEGINGDVTVTGVPNAGGIVVRGERRVTSLGPPDAGSRLDDIVIDIFEQAGELVVRTLQPAEATGYDYAVHYELLVPEWFVASVYNVNGLVAVQALSSGTAIVNSNGPVTVRGLIGSAFVDNINGDIVAEAAIFRNGFIDLRTVNGSILLDVPVQTSATLEAIVTNGDISVHNLVVHDREVGNGYLTGRLGFGEGEIKLVTTNGNISIRGVGR